MHVAQPVLKGGLDGKSYIASERWEEVWDSCNHLHPLDQHIKP
jgi:hypothetical protein